MSTSPRTFEQVKGILGKLDARIDALRQRRSEPATQLTPSALNPGQIPTAASVGPNTYIGGGPKPSGTPVNGVHNGQANGLGNGIGNGIGNGRPIGHAGTSFNGTGGAPVSPTAFGTPSTGSTNSGTNPGASIPGGPVLPGTPGRSGFGRATPLRNLSA
jgi:hypothetical protein